MEKEASGNLDGLEIGALDVSEVGEALGVLVRGMRDNPTHVAAFGEDAERRQKRVSRMFSGSMEVLGWHEHMLVARDADEAIVGAAGNGPPGACRPSASQKLRLLPGLLSNGPRAAERMMRWLGAWVRHDPDERHWHFGPFAVDAHLQGMGIGSKLLRVSCARMDAAGDDAYLETDKPENVRLYERFGFEVVGEEDVLGVPTGSCSGKRRGGRVSGSTQRATAPSLGTSQYGQVRKESSWTLLPGR